MMPMCGSPVATRGCLLVVVSVTVAKFATTRETVDDLICASLISVDVQWCVLSHRLMNKNNRIPEAVSGNSRPRARPAKARNGPARILVGRDFKLKPGKTSPLTRTFAQRRGSEHSITDASISCSQA
jgi:hypothetical protein